MSTVFPTFTKTYHHKPYPAIDPARPELNANGKVVLITGAGTGVGEATAHAFAAAGAKAVILCGRRLDPLNKVKHDVESKHSSTKAAVYSLDISSEDDVRRVFQEVKSTYGPLNVVVNSAGHLSDKGTVAESSLSNFWSSFQITVKGGFLVAQSFLHNCSNNDPVLISMNSLLAHMAAEQVGTAPGSYASSKMAQGKMIEYVAKENVGKVRAYNVHPGTIITDRSTKSVEMSADPEATWQSHVWDDVSLPAHFSVWLSSKQGHVIPTGKYLWAHWDVDEFKQRSKELFEDPMALTLTLNGWPFPQPEVVDK